MPGPADLLTRAIRGREVVEFAYHGEPRQVEPYALGWVAGRLTLRGWQSRKGWRSFHVEAMADVALAGRHFDEPREGYAPDARMDRVLAAL
jgi:predicted DNA-binding transcriptional regulator YafY